MLALTAWTPLASLAQAKAGDVAGAQALVATTPLDCYNCVVARGQIDAVAHDPPGAARWFAEAVRQGPSLPFAYLEWGRALLDRGEVDRAVAELTLAHQKGPRFADPLEVWGEALMRRRDYAGAAAKFAEADRDAPRWGRNHLYWGEALMLAGHYREGRKQFETANALDLSAHDRAALNVLLERTAKGPLHG
jgi:tetratricopeptide (TPR) repeat protein